jgi:hypothetical protein
VLPREAPQRACLFDIDNTLTHGANASQAACCAGGTSCFVDSPPPAWPAHSGTNTYVREIVSLCREKGFAIGVTTAESGKDALNPTQKAFIDSTVGPGIYASFAYQNSCTVITQPWCKENPYNDKTVMYINMMNAYNIPPSEWQNSIVFDDLEANLVTARGLGFRTCRASPSCGGEYCSTGCGLERDCLVILQDLADAPSVKLFQ